MENDTERMTVDPEAMLEAAAKAVVPPDYCPMCFDNAKAPSKDERGRWTWNCLEGCNP